MIALDCIVNPSGDCTDNRNLFPFSVLQHELERINQSCCFFLAFECSCFSGFLCSEEGEECVISL